MLRRESTKQQCSGEKMSLEIGVCRLSLGQCTLYRTHDGRLASVMKPGFHGSQRGIAHQRVVANSGQQRFYGKFNFLLMPWLLTSVPSFSVSENNIGLAWLLKEACQEDLNRQI